MGGRLAALEHLGGIPRTSYQAKPIRSVPPAMGYRRRAVLHPGKEGLGYFGRRSHTHVPVAFIRDSMVRGGTYSKFKVEAGKKYFINVGAVGQPRDGNPKSAYVIYDTDEQTVELRRLDYDIAAAQKKILDAGLPPRLAERLAFGR